MRHTILKFIKRFVRNNQGTMTVEAVMNIPLIFFVYLFMFVAFQAFEAKNNSTKAIVAISQILNRAPAATSGDVDSNFFNRINRLQKAVSNTNRNDSLRVSLVQYNQIPMEHNIVWSIEKGSGFATTLSGTIPSDPFPDMGDGQKVLYIETITPFKPLFDVVKIKEIDFRNQIVMPIRNIQGTVCYNDGAAITC